MNVSASLLLEYSIRIATLDDTKAIQAIVADCLTEYGLRYDRDGVDGVLEDVERFFMKDGGCFWVAVNRDNVVIGTVGVRKHPSACSTQAEPIWELEKLYVIRQHRGHGVGKRLLELAVSFVREKGAHFIELTTSSVLKEATQMYEKRGFKKQPSDCQSSSRCDLSYKLMF